MAIRILLRALVTVGIFSLAIGAASAQAEPLEYWSGSWTAPQTGESGYLEFLLTEDGLISGSITNGPMVGLWSGFVRDDGVIFAEYTYPTTGFTALAAAVVTEVAGNIVGGQMLFVTYDNQLVGLGQFQLARVYAAPGAQNVSESQDTPATNYPFTGNGMYVYCAAPSVCGDRGANTLPGNWGWTTGLFDDIRQNYPQVYCNLYANAC